MRKCVVLLTVTAILALMLAGCGGATGGGSGEKSSGTPGGGTSTIKGTVVKTVVVKESEFELTPSAITLKKPGTYTFRAENAGSTGHALEIEGKGLETETNVLDPGKGGEIKVKLKPGTYEMYCPVDSHEDKGMKGKVTVAGKSNSSGNSDGGGSGGPGGGY